MNNGLGDQQFRLLKMVHLVYPVAPMELLLVPVFSSLCGALVWVVHHTVHQGGSQPDPSSQGISI